MKTKLLEVEKVAQKYNESILKPATDEQIEKFIHWSSDKQIPSDEYVQFVKLANGLDFNGLVVYSIKETDDNNIYNANEIWHENKNLINYVMFSDSDTAWLCYDCDKCYFCELDKPSGTLMNTYSRFSEMMELALEQIL